MEIKEKKRKVELSKRTLDIMTLVSKGFNDKEMAKHLKISPSTVISNIRIALRDTGCVNRCHLVAWGFRNGVLK